MIASLALPSSKKKSVALIFAAISYIVVGVTHFTNPNFFLDIVPPSLPAPLALVYISGIFEILGGIGLLIPRTRQWASWGLIALLFSVYPANIYMAMNTEIFEAKGFSAASLYVRLPFQFVFIAWAWWVGKPDPQK